MSLYGYTNDSITEKTEWKILGSNEIPLIKPELLDTECLSGTCMLKCNYW